MPKLSIEKTNSHKNPTTHSSHGYIQQYKVEVDPIIFYYGMHSPISVIQNSRRVYPYSLSNTARQQLQETSTLSLEGSAIISETSRNSTTTSRINLAESTTTDGRCPEKQYSDPYGTWDTVQGHMVQGTIKIVLKYFVVLIERTSLHLVLPSEQRCDARRRECLDSESAQTFWPLVPQDSCQFDRYDVLYEDTPTKSISRDNHTMLIVFTVTTKETTFALAKTAEFNLCGYIMTQSKYSKLFILETKRVQMFKARSKISTNYLNIIAYVNSKFVYVKKHIKTQLTKLYTNIMERKCAREK